ncbi:MAG TPA: ribosome-associated translation inhibitor RaiA [Candidatus Ruthenibacterium avium]|uniref:Ribosome hibernation promoting factor n=1 Tax=Candidatus Ruthenibacterium avium TaxID=2838751 RepID=A0A9D2M3R5_9FIRM|nr:ribosome-associated translation inhibitor RaiA [Candidatus Ruthenibacterium avium]
MKITCTGRKVTLKEAFLERVEKKLAKLDKFFSDDAQAQVTVTVEKDWQTVEITVRDKGFASRAEKSGDRMEEAFDSALDLLTRRIIKNRKKLENRVCQPAVQDYIAQEYTSGDPVDEQYDVIREKHFIVKPCTVEEAILQMNMLGHAFFLYRDADTDSVQVVYRRKNGSYGVLVPENN